MAIPKILTFEELQKKIKQPKVTVSGLDDLNFEGAAELGYKIPPNWKLRRLEGVDSLISPRGNIFKDLKLSPEGTIEDFRVFSPEGALIKLPPSLVKPPPIEPPPAIEPSIKPPPREEDLDLIYANYQRTGGELGIEDWKRAGTPLYKGAEKAKPEELPPPVEPPEVEAEAPRLIQPEELRLLPVGFRGPALAKRLRLFEPKTGRGAILGLLRSEGGLAEETFQHLTGMTWRDFTFVPPGQRPEVIAALGGDPQREQLSGIRTPSGESVIKLKTVSPTLLEKMEERGKAIREEPSIIGKMGMLYRYYADLISASPTIPLFKVAGVPITTGTAAAFTLIAMGVYQVGSAGWNALLDKVLSKPGKLNVLGRQLTRAALNRNFDIYSRQTGATIPKATRNAFIDRYLNDMAKFFSRGVEAEAQKGTLTALQLQGASVATYKQATDVFNREFIPTATQTGAMVMGGLPEPTIASVVTKIVSNQALTAAERQLYANQAQAVEDALKAQQVAPTPSREVVGAVPAVRAEVPEEVTNIINRITVPAVTPNAKLVDLNVAKFDVKFAEDVDNYVGEGGTGAVIGDRYERFKTFLETGKPIEAAEVQVKAGGSVMFMNGRNRYAVLRDMGMTNIPVVMDAKSIANAKKFGYITEEVALAEAPVTGEEIAGALGVKFDGMQKMPAKMQAEFGAEAFTFTDPQSGSTFLAKDLAQAHSELVGIRKSFGMPAPEALPAVEAAPPAVPTAEIATIDTRIAEINKLLETKGRLPAGMGTKTELSLELARLEAQREVAQFTNLDQLETAISEIEQELGLRGMPFHGRAPAAFAEFTTKQLDEMIRVYEEARPDVIVREVPSEAQVATNEIQAIQEQGRTAPESVTPDDAKKSHIELAAPDGPKPPKPPTAKKGAADIFGEITEKGYNERVDQTLLRLHEAAIGNETRRTALAIKAGGKKLREQDIGVWRRDHLIPRPKDIAKLDELYIALHNPTGVEAGTVKVPEGFERVYEELRGLADWETAALLDFDPNAATIDDWFFRGWKPPTDMFTGTGARLGVKPKALRTPRVDATYQELRDLGFEPLFWNPYEQWGYRHNLGMKYREQMELIKNLKAMGDELIRPHDGGPIPLGWKVPEVGPAFEGKPFAIKDPDTGTLGVMFTRRWITEGKIANSLENIYGKRPNLGKFVIKGKEIDPMTIIDAITFLPKRAKLFLSFFQQVDFLTRAGAGSWSQAVDALLAGKPVEAVTAVAKYPVTFAKVLQANFSPTARLKLSQQMDNTKPIIQDRPGINLKGISEAGLSTRDVTIFPADMDKLVREVANETGIMAKGKRLVGAVGDMESAMRRGLFDGVYPAAIVTDIQNNIASMVARQHPSLNDAQINGIIARIANIKYSTIPASQSVIQNRMLRETLRRVFFSIGESEGLLRQATNVFHGPNKRFWGKHFLGVYLFLIVTASIIHYASTRKPLPLDRYSPISTDSWGPLPFGYNTKFAAPTLPIKGRGGVELTLDLAGQMDTAFRVLDPINFLTSRESVPVRSITNQISGTDFFGAPIDDIGPGGIVSRTSQLLHDLFAPIGLGGITGEAARQFIPGATEIVPRAEDRLGLAGQAIQATGMNVRAETTMNLLDRYAKESGFNKADGTPVEKWDDLEPYQKNEVSRNEELETELGLRSEAAVEREQLGALGFATLDAIDKERVVRGEALASTLFRDLEAEDADRSNLAYDFRKEATALKREISVRKAQVDEDFQLFKDTGKIEKDPNKRALTEYYNTFDLATNKLTKVIDWDKQDALELALRRKWTDAQEAYVDRNIGLTEWGPLFDDYEQQRRTLSDSGYWETESKHRKNFRRANPEIEAILTGKFYGYVPLSEQISRTAATRMKLAGAGFRVSRVSPRRATVTYPKFKKPKIPTGLSIGAPSAPGV